MNKDYKCTICSRLFIKPLPHKCIGNFRKHHLRKIFINIKENKDMTREQLIEITAEEVAAKGCHKLKTFQLEYYEQLVGAFIEGVKLAEEYPVSLVHSSEEKPNSYPILCLNKFNNIWVQHDLEEDYTWEEFVKNESIINWVYITDILPKGGEK